MLTKSGTTRVFVFFYRRDLEPDPTTLKYEERFREEDVTPQINFESYRLANEQTDR